MSIMSFRNCISVSSLHHFRIRGHSDGIEGTAYVDEGTVLTSAGVSAGIQLSLYLVGRMLDAPTALHTARLMEYQWRPEQ
ncbi:hypothetical protein ACFFNY_06815 [Paenibacillus hodogayensis]|uniref:DJ-1/PfpI domain-containing protein n=1 Tax=Paenibacillus hodogayensis TaxID=279208 RepID=A0ABV5VSJ8_9BACL